MKIIDVHAHIWAGDYMNHKKIILKAIEKYNIDKVFISGLAEFMPTKERVAELNEAVYQFSKEFPDYIKGYTYISPEHDNALEVIKRGVEEQGSIGGKIWVSEKCDAVSVNVIAEQLIKYKLPLLIHTWKQNNPGNVNESTAVEIRNLALRYPELNIVMAHIGGNAYHGVPLIRDLKNVWVDISGGDFWNDVLPYTVENIGAERILFGTDMIGGFIPSYGQVMDADITDEEREKILYKNAEKLYGLV